MAREKRFVVTFFKTVSTDYGEDREIRQRAVEVFGNDKIDALKRAKSEFSRLEGFRDWAAHADRFEIEQPNLSS